MLEHGFARLWCGECRRSVLVAFSCRGRSFCPSCEKKKQLLWGVPLAMLWRAGRVAAFLVWLVATLAVAAGLAWAGYRIRVLLRESRAGNVGG